MPYQLGMKKIDEAIQCPCPTCEAIEGEPCETKDGRSLGFTRVHKRRHDAWQNRLTVTTEGGSVTLEDLVRPIEEGITTGIFLGLSDAEYHGDTFTPGQAPSISSSMLRDALRQPLAAFDYKRKQPTTPTDAMEVGTIVHSLVLGTPSPVVTVDATSWRTNAAKEARETARAQGLIPILAQDLPALQQMASSVRNNTEAARLLDLEGVCESSWFWTDTQTGMLCRARPDKAAFDGDRLVIIDYKTTQDASEDGFSKAIATFGYHQQHAWYARAAVELGLVETIEDVDFFFIVQEIHAHNLTAVYRISGRDVELGEMMNDHALAKLAAAFKNDSWPGYPNKAKLIQMPAWAYGRDEHFYGKII